MSGDRAAGGAPSAFSLGRFAKDIGWTTAANLVAQVSGIVATVAGARILGIEEFGLLGLIQASLLPFQAAGSMGLATTATVVVASKLGDKAEARRAASSILCWTLVCCGAVAMAAFLGASVVSTYTVGDARLGAGIRLAACSLLAGSLMTVLQGLLTGLGEFRHYSYSSAVRGLTLILFTPLLAYPFGTMGVLTAQVVSFGVTVCWLLVLLWREPIGVLRWDAMSLRREDLPLLFGFTLPSLLSGLAVAIATWWGTAYLARHAGTRDVAINTSASQLRAVLLFVPSVTAAVLSPYFARSAGNAGEREDRRLLLLGSGVNGVAGLLCLGVFLLFGRQSLAIFGDGFDRHIGVLLPYLLSGVVILLFSPLAQWLTAQRMQWTNLGVNVAWGVVMAVLTVRWIDGGFGVVGFAYALLAGYVVQTILYVAVYGRSQVRGGRA